MLVPVLIFRNGVPSVLGGAPQVAPGAAKSSPQDVGKVPFQVGRLPASSSPAVSFDIDERIEPFVQAPAYISMSYKVGRIYKYAVTIAGQSMTNNDMLDLGYTIKQLGSCGLELSRDGFRRVITCQIDEKIAQGKTDMAATPSAPQISSLKQPASNSEGVRTAQL